MKRLFFLLPLALAFLQACQEDISLDLPEYKSKVAVFCVLNADSTPILYLNRSISYFDYSDTTKSNFFVKDAEVRITDLNTMQVDIFQSDSGMIRNLYSQDGKTYFAWYYKGKMLPQPGHRYRLDIKVGDEELSSETTVPEKTIVEKPEIRKDTSEPFNTRYQIKFKFQDQIAFENTYQSFKAFANYFYNPVTGKYEEVMAYFYPNEDFITDIGKDGAKMEVSTDLYTYNNQDSIIYYYSIENLNRTTGKYLEAVIQQQYGNSDPFSEPVMLVSNIKGGLGHFGSSAFSDKIRVVVK